MGNSDKNDNKNINFSSSQQEVKAMFHDFLGAKAIAINDKETVDVAGGGRPLPPSSASDLASERQMGNHLEGIPFYGPRSEVSASEITNRLIGGKRSNPESAFSGSNRDGVSQTGQESRESLQLIKLLKNVGGGDRPRRSSDDGIFYGTQSMRPSSASLLLQPTAGGNRDAGVSKWDQSIPTGTALHYPRGNQLAPFAHQVSTSRFRDNNPVPSIISQPAADEGSRTGIKGPGILSSLNSGSGTLEKNLSTSVPSSSKMKLGTHFSEPDSSSPSQPGLTSASRQMTIFYGGRAHVFDDVHPNKADVIMALAGSNGGSWSTAYSPKHTTSKTHTESYTASREHNDTSGVPSAALHREIHGRPSGNSSAPSQGVAGKDGRPQTVGIRRESIVTSKDSRSRMQSGEAITEDKRD